ncbi:MAG: ComEA family DNA-binding protein, partial [Bacteroidota bacterium]
TKTDTTHRFRKPAKPVRRVEYDLNLADTADFESVSGIGKKMAARIVRYRTALGGFIRREQLYEVFGIDSLAVFSMDRFHVTATFSPAMVQVNAATWEELDAHPYLTPIQASAVLMYRFQHGRIAGEQELMKVRLMDAKTVERIRPYLDYR